MDTWMKWPRWQEWSLWNGPISMEPTYQSWAAYCLIWKFNLPAGETNAELLICHHSYSSSPWQQVDYIEFIPSWKVQHRNRLLIWGMHLQPTNLHRAQPSGDLHNAWSTGTEYNTIQHPNREISLQELIYSFQVQEGACGHGFHWLHHMLHVPESGGLV